MVEIVKPIYTVQVRELVEFVLRAGDLAGERQFVGMDRAVQGIRGHQKIQRSRPPGYATEIAVEHEIHVDTFTLVIRGRLDGVLRSPGELLIEEIKTVHGKWDREAEPLHWAQAKIYAYIYASKESAKEVVIQLTYLELETSRVTEFRQPFSIEELGNFFTTTTTSYLEWIREEVRWLAVRNESVRQLNFPFQAYRPGQREMAVTVYKTLTGGGRAFIAAPTGIGKTISALFPAAKALGEGKLKRIYYLTARTVGQGMAEKAVRDLRQGGLRLRTVTLTARHKVCINENEPCDTRTCPLATGYYDRRKSALREALAHEDITREYLDALGQKHQVCPFALAHDVSLWADVVICDYNYVFDPKAYLQSHFAEESDGFGFLVDEAHNLVDRARDMFSDELNAEEIHQVRRAIKTKLSACAKALMRLEQGIKALDDPAAVLAEDVLERVREPDLFQEEWPGETATPKVGAVLRPLNESGQWVLKDFPQELIPGLEAALEQMEKWLASNEETSFRDALLTLYFKALSFRRTAERYDERFVTLVKKADSGDSVLVRLFCLDPSHLLRLALERGRAAVFFSATLTPIDYYRALLGGETADSFLQLDSPFPQENLAMLVHNRIATHYKARANSLGEVVTAVGALLNERRGNYLIYFPSYQYLAAVLEEFKDRFPQVETLAQRPDMTEQERFEFLAAFEVQTGVTRAGFAVLGGIFGEGIDLVGERLIGVVIVGVGMPQLCLERDLIRDYFEERNRKGFDYAYTFPGMNRVLQAAGRVVRSETDRGAVLLMDARFDQARYRRLFPTWWQTANAGSVEKIQRAAAKFWAAKSGE